MRTPVTKTESSQGRPFPVPCRRSVSPGRGIPPADDSGPDPPDPFEKAAPEGSKAPWFSLTEFSCAPHNT